VIRKRAKLANSHQVLYSTFYVKVFLKVNKIPYNFVDNFYCLITGNIIADCKSKNRIKSLKHLFIPFQKDFRSNRTCPFASGFESFDGVK